MNVEIWTETTAIHRKGIHKWDFPYSVFNQIFLGGHLAVQAWKKNGGDGQFLTGIQAERILVKEMRRKMEATRSE